MGNIGHNKALLEGQTILPELQITWNSYYDRDRMTRIFTFAGQICDVNSHELNQKFIHFIEDENFTNAILDLENLHYINSQGIAILHAIVSKLQDKNILIVVGGIHPFLREVFSLIEELSSMKVFDSLEEAKKYLPWLYHS